MNRRTILSILLAAFLAIPFRTSAGEPSPGWAAYLDGAPLEEVTDRFREEIGAGSDAGTYCGLAHVLRLQGQRRESVLALAEGLRSDPSGPLAFLLADQVDEESGFSRGTDRAIFDLLSDLEGRTDVDPHVRYRLIRLEYNLALRSGDIEKIRRAERACGFFEGAFFSEPESRLTYLAFLDRRGAPGRADSETWTHETNHGPQVRPSAVRLEEDTENLYHGVSAFEVRRPAEALLYTSGWGSHRIFLDDRLVLERESFDDQPVPSGIHRVHLSAGLHRISFTVHAQWPREGISLALLDANGSGLDVRPVVNPERAWSPTAASRLKGRLEPRFETGFPRDDSRRKAFEALWLRWEGDGAAARLMMEEAALASPRAVPWNMWAARLYLFESDDLPDKIAEARAERALDNVLSVAPECPLALYFKSLLIGVQSENGDDLAILRRLAQEVPEDPQWSLELARSLMEHGWAWQAREVLEATSTYHPESPQILSDWVSYFAQIPDRNAQREAIERLESFGFMGHEWAAYYRATGDADSLIPLLEHMAAIFGDRDMDFAQQIAEATLEAGDFETARDRFKNILESAPRHQGAALGAARCAFMLGDDAEGWRILRDLKARIPHAFHVDLLEWLYGKEFPFEEHSLDLETVLAEDAADGPEEAPSSLLLDQMLTGVQEDGSSIERVHTVIRINDKSGVDREGEQALRGQVILQARTVKPDGTILEPEQIPEKQTLSMPGLEPGDLVELETIVFQSANRIRENTYITPSVFLFQDIDRPFHRTQWRIEYPAGMDMEFLQQNLPREGVFTREGSRKAANWDYRSMPRIAPEPLAPHRLHFVPLVEAVGGIGWKDLGMYLKDNLTGSFRKSPELRRVYREVMEGVGETERDRIDAILEFVFDAIDGEGEGTWQDPTQTLLTRQGSRIQVAGAFLDLAGIRWEMLLAEAIPNRVPAVDLPRLGQYGISLLRITLKGEEPGYYMLSSPYRKPGVLPWYLQGAHALNISSDTPWRTIVLPEDFSGWMDPLEREERTLGASGDLHLSHTQELDPDSQEAFRSAFHKISRDEWGKVIQITLSKEFGNLDLHDFDLGGVSDPAAPFQWDYEITLKGYAPPEEDRMVLHQPIPSLQVSRALASLEERRLPMAPASPYFMNQEYVLHLPEGARTEYRLPNAVIETRFGSYRIETTREGNTFVFRRRLHIPYQVIRPEAYQAFSDFVESVDRAEAGQMVVEVPAAP